MPDRPGNLVFLVGLVLCGSLIHGPHVRGLRRRMGARAGTRPADAVLEVLTLIACHVLPWLSIAFLWLTLAESRLLPTRGLGIGTVLLAGSLAWLWRADRGLGRHWSPRHDILKRHALLTSGTYARIRRAICAGIWLWALPQTRLVQNWFAEWSMMVRFGIPSAIRGPREQRLVVIAFGEAHRSDAEHTARVLPRLRR
jgi:protein-S-isoprenylcysteine O-methyltransferase Ste14